MTTAAVPADISNPQPGVRRSFTAPNDLGGGARRQGSSKRLPENAHTLFAYHSSRIVSFAASAGSKRESVSAADQRKRQSLTGAALIEERRRSISGAAVLEKKRQSISEVASNDSRRQSVYGSLLEKDADEPVGVLPWKTKGERVMATGPIYVYTNPNSLPYLYCDPLIRPIMTRSQCWCVDGETIFVMRVGVENYYRIELPNKNDEDQTAAAELKGVLAKILQYETTACPFKRGFDVELPERPDVILTPWKVKHKPIAARDAPSDESDGRTSSSRGASSDEREPISEEDEGPLGPRREGPIREEQDPGTPVVATASAQPQSPYVETVVSNFETMKVSEDSFTPSSQRTRQFQPGAEISGDAGEGDGHLAFAEPQYGESRTAESATTPDETPALTNEETARNSEAEAVAQPLNAEITSSREAFLIHSEDQPEELPPRHSEEIPAPVPEQASSQASEEFPKLPEQDVSEQLLSEQDTAPPQDMDSDAKYIATAGIRWIEFESEDQRTPTAIPPVSRAFTAPASAYTAEAKVREDQLRDEPANLLQPVLAPLSTEIDEQLPLGDSLDADPESPEADTISIASTADSFYSTYAPPTRTNSIGGPLAPGFEPVPSGMTSLHMPRVRGHKHTDSELTVRPDSSDDEPSTPEWLELSPITETFSPNAGVEESPGTVLSASDPVSSSRQASPASILRKRLHQRRALSPLPSASVLYNPRDEFPGTQLAATIVQTTYHYLRGPSGQLLSIMASIAARIAGGAMIDASYDVHTGRKIPCAWDSDSSISDDADSEDDGYKSSASESSATQRGRRLRGESEQAL